MDMALIKCPECGKAVSDKFQYLNVLNHNIKKKGTYGL